MPGKMPSILLCVFGLMILTALTHAVLAQEPQPGDACPEDSRFTRVAGPENPGSGHFLFCDSDLIWQPVMRFQSAGHVLFNSGGLPAAPLHVWGEAIIGNEGLACEATTEGAIRYDSGSDIVELCDGSSWSHVGAGSAVFELNTGVVRNTGDHATEDFVFGSPQLGDDGNSNHHSRLFFDKSKGAFRAGTGADSSWLIDGGTDVWDDANVGSFSAAFGYYAEASGDYSFAAGRASVASGNLSMALGDIANASNVGSVAIGAGANSSGSSSVAIGSSARASGDFSIAIGAANRATGKHSAAFGPYIEAQADHTLGIQLNSDAPGTHIITQPNTMAVMGGNVGFGTVAPAAPLEVAGEVIVGAGTGLACDPTRTGGLRYSSANTCFEFCDGSNWACIAAQPCGDVTPDGFDFTDLVNQSTSTLVTSDIIQITGLGCVVNVQVSGEGSPQYRTCSDSGCSTVIQDWASGSNTISNNDYIQLRLTTSAAGGDTYSATLAIGNGADVWNATTTGDCTGSPAPGTVCADGTVYAGLSPDGNVKMYVTRCDAGQSWDGSACTGTRLSLPWNDGDSNYVTTSYTSSITGETNTSGIAAIDSNDVTGGFQDHVASVYCNDLSQDGQSDWYLPAREELNVIYGNKGVIANFSGASYWSSSENDNVTAWRQSFSDGSQNYSNKDNAFHARCARR